jgi:hypothetical protein
MEEKPLPELQRNVQRLLGRCVVRLQQYEHLLKAVLAQHELAGPLDTLEARHAEAVEKMSGMTLGQLAKVLFETYVVQDGFERDLLSNGKTPTDKASVAVSFRMSMSPEDWSKTKAAIEELVALRNELVHHFIERHDLWTEDGCASASRHLDDGYQRIDHHFHELLGWAESMKKARGLAAQVAQSSAFQDMVLHGIGPDGTFVWPETGIVCALREALQVLAIKGWAQLDQACSWIAKTHAEQEAPQKYACRTWPQVLNESRLFDLEYRPDKQGRKIAWFRERTP